MSLHLARSRLLARLSNHARITPRSSSFSSTTTSAAGAAGGHPPSPTEPIVSSDFLPNDTPPGAAPSAAAAAAAGGSAKRSFGLLKFGTLAAITGAIGTTAYVTFAYSLDEMEHKAVGLQSMLKEPLADDASGFEKYKNLFYTAAMKVSVKAIDMYLDVRRSLEDQVRGFTEPSSEKLLPDLLPLEQHVFTLVLDLNETLVYSDWKRDRGWRTFKRPGVDAFLEHLAKFYEIVVYSDQLQMYVDPVIDRLDQKGCIRYRLSRPATKYENGKHYRDLSKLNRDPSRVLYISAHALESSLQPENSVPIKPWKLENDDTALVDLIPFLEYVALHRPADIRPVLASYQGRDIASEFIERSKEHQRRMQEQKQHGVFWKR